MDLLSFAAFSGIERVAVIVGSLIIGYWGYRLYGKDKTPGLIFMGIACAVLIAALATGGSYVRSVGASYQLAGAGSEEPAVGTPVADAAAEDAIETAGNGKAVPAVTQVEGAAVPEPSAGDVPPEPDAKRKDTESAFPSSSATAEPATADREQPRRSDAEPSNGILAQTKPAAAAQTETAAEPETAAELASSQELGGRIVSVKSANVTLEWSRE